MGAFLTTVCLWCCVQDNGQGLGFVICGVVLDLKLLGRIALAVGSWLGGLCMHVPAGCDPSHHPLSSPPADDAASGGVACELSTVQTDTIRALLSARNASCSYENATIGSVLGGKGER